MKQLDRRQIALQESNANRSEPQGPLVQLSQMLLDLVSSIPAARERGRADPAERAAEVIRAAKSKAALTAGSLALPPGPLGWATVLPEIYAVWKIQAQMVSDLAALHGRKSSLTREQMLYCLFRHTGAQLFRDLVIRVGERYLVRRLPVRSIYAVVNKIGIRLTQRSIGRAISRVVPVAGALGVAGYSWYDTRQVAHTALALFSREIEMEPRPGGGEKTSNKHKTPASKRSARGVASRVKPARATRETKARRATRS